MTGSFDANVVIFLAEHRAPGLTLFFDGLTDLGGAAVVALVLVGSYYILAKSRRWPYAVGLMTSLAGALLTSNALKVLVGRQRPPMILRVIYEFDPSFPSNHATAAAALYGFLAYSAWKIAPNAYAKYTAIAVCVLLILGIGFSRIYLGVHYPSDIIAGFIVGFAFTYLGIRITRALESIRNRESS